MLEGFRRESSNLGAKVIILPPTATKSHFGMGQYCRLGIFIVRGPDELSSCSSICLAVGSFFSGFGLSDALPYYLAQALCTPNLYENWGSQP